jgi:hypothetical protein
MMKSATVLCALVAALSTPSSLTVVSPPGGPQSFDCRKATTAVEKIICADADLSMLDEQMAKAFTDARKRVDVTVIGQPGWLKNVRNRCASADCLTGAYKSRIVYLRNLMSALPAAPTNDAPTPYSRWLGEHECCAGKSRDVYTGVLSVTVSAGKPHVEVEVGQETGCRGGIGGTLVISGAHADLAPPLFAIPGDDQSDDACALAFELRADSSIRVTETSCAGYHGLNCGFAGEYRLVRKQ